MSSKTRQQVERRGQARTAEAVAGDLRAPAMGVTGEALITWARVHWQALAFAAVVAIGAIFRFYNLGARALHHDESLHSFYAFRFSQGHGYDHIPFMHGTFQFIGNGIVMKLWPWGGATDFSARVMAATLGTLMILLIFYLRDWLTRPGAFAAAIFVVISPTLMYFSRFTREDIYTAFWTLGIVVSMWRYLADRRDIYLYMAAGFLAFSFATKESTYLTAGLFIVYMNYLCTLEFAPRIADSMEVTLPERRLAIYAVVFPFAWLMVAFWPLLDWEAIGAPKKKWNLEFPAAGWLLVILGTMTLPQLAALSQKLGHYIPDVGPLSSPHSFFRDHGIEQAANSHILASEDKLAKSTVMVLLLGSLVVGILHDLPRLREWSDYFRAKGPGWLNAYSLLIAPAYLTAAMPWFLPVYFLLPSPKPKLPRWLTAAAVFWFIYVILYTTFFTNPAGFWSGIWGGMDYWMSQQHVRRGDQPDFYYFMLLPVYEFLPLTIAFIGALYYAFRGSIANKIVCGLALLVVLIATVSGAHFGPFTSVHLSFLAVLLALLLLPMPRFTHFLLFWTIGVLFGLTVAGEKMPWLNVHIALPLAILGGHMVGRFLSRTDLRPDLPPVERWAPFAYAALATALAAIVFIRVGPSSVASLGGWLLVLVAVAAVGWAFNSYTRFTALQVAVAAAVAVMFVFTLRAAVLASWGHPNLSYVQQGESDHGDTPVEMLVYTQTSPDIPKLAGDIDRAAHDSGLGKDLPIVVDQADSFAWPWVWYLRDYRAVSYVDLSSQQTYKPPQGAILLINKNDVSKLDLSGSNLSQGITYHHRWWFPETYRESSPGEKMTTRGFFGMIKHIGIWKHWRDYFINRTITQPPGSVDAVAYFPQSFQTSIQTQPQTPVESVRTENGQLLVGGPGGAPGQFQQPDGVAVDSAGNLYVADSKNNRIQVFGPDGHYLRSVGGSLGARDGEMQEPWGLAVDSGGNVYVADTWNWRVQKFDKDLNFAKTWGHGDNKNLADLTAMYGPRAIAIDAAGDVLVVDTGNKRVTVYSQDGDPKSTFGTAGSGPGQFNEPVGIAVDANGDIWVADTWNGRIEHFGRDFQYIGEISVPGWAGTKPDDAQFLPVNKPYIAVTADRVLATVPTDGKVLVFDKASGQQLAAWAVPGVGGAQARPIGIAVAPDGQVWVADAFGSVVRKVPISLMLGQ